MKLFVIRVNDFDPDKWRALVPSNSRRLCNETKLREYQAGLRDEDRILIVGTVNQHTPSNVKGRMLALVLVHGGMHHTKDFIDEPYLSSGFIKDRELGKIKKPYCLPYKEAVVFDKRPHRLQVITDTIEPMKRSRDHRFQVHPDHVDGVIRHLDGLRSTVYSYALP